MGVAVLETAVQAVARTKIIISFRISVHCQPQMPLSDPGALWSALRHGRRADGAGNGHPGGGKNKNHHEFAHFSGVLK
jgi:hypothetical protein